MKIHSRKMLALFIAMLLGIYVLFAFISCDEENEITTQNTDVSAEITDVNIDITTEETAEITDVSTDVITEVTTEITDETTLTQSDTDQGTAEITTEITTEVTTEVTTIPETTAQEPVVTTPEGYVVINSPTQLEQLNIGIDAINLDDELYVRVTEQNGDQTYIALDSLQFDASGNIYIDWFNKNNTPLVFNKSLLSTVTTQNSITVTDKQGNVIELDATEHHTQYILDENGVLKSIITLPPDGNINTYSAPQSVKYQEKYTALNPSQAQTPFSWDDLDATPFDIKNLQTGNNAEVIGLLNMFNQTIGDTSRRHITIYKNDIPCYEYMFDNSMGLVCFNLDSDGNRTLDVAYLYSGHALLNYGIEGKKYYLDNNGKLMEKREYSFIPYNTEGQQLQLEMYYKLANLFVGNSEYDDCFVIEPLTKTEYYRTSAILGINTNNGVTYMNIGGIEKTKNYNIETTVDNNKLRIESYSIAGEKVSEALADYFSTLDNEKFQ